MRPLVGVPCHGEYEDGADAPRRYVLGRSYVEALRRAGGAVVAIPCCTDPDMLRPIYNSLSGLLLAGGGDMRPRVYRQPETAKLISVDPERDEAELLLTRWATEDDLPLFAICRGIQVLNVALGGTLIQDIPAAMPEALVHHPGPAAPRHRAQHGVVLVPGSRLSTILGRGRPLPQVQVNSFHHQAADEVAPSLRVSARATDGVIEGLECPDRAFVLGVQWHPEEMAARELVQQALFVAFVRACRARRPHG
jgi:putative glutamine amidotransferase